MSAKRTLCVRCGGPKGPGQGRKLCELCINDPDREPIKMIGPRFRTTYECPECGARRDSRAKTCRGCWEKNPPRTTHCKRGHERTPENTYINSNGSQCFTCTRVVSLEKNYNLTEEQFNQMLDRQGGKCGIPGCEKTEPGNGKDWCVDHDHACPNGCNGRLSCGECVRGLLCGTCNMALGGVNDNVEVLMGMIGYVQNHRLLYLAVA